MKRIIIHWTAGAGKPNATDLQHYHFLIDSEGVVHNGKYKPEDNENCQDGRYAAHTGGGNTGSIGVALCGMCGFSGVNNVGSYPLTKKQCERAFKLCAELCKKYNIAITSSNVLTHYEFGKSHPNTSSAGKIDITWLPYSDVDIKKTLNIKVITNSSYSDFIRNKIKWYKSQT